MPAPQMAQPGQFTLALASPPMFLIAQHVLLTFCQKYPVLYDSPLHIGNDTNSVFQKSITLNRPLNILFINSECYFLLKPHSFIATSPSQLP